MVSKFRYYKHAFCLLLEVKWTTNLMAFGSNYDLDLLSYNYTSRY